MSKNINNKKAQIMVISTIIAVVVALTTSYILLQYLFEEKSPDEFLGSYQSAIIDAMADGDKIQIYVDQSAKMAMSTAMDDYTMGPPKIRDSGDSGIEDYCGSYVYRLWNTETKNCYPKFSTGLTSVSEPFALDILMNKHLANLTYLLATDPSDKNAYLSSILKQSIAYDFKYIADVNHTSIVGYTNDKYTVYLFKNKDVRNSLPVINYVQAKTQLGGSANTGSSGYTGSVSGTGGDIPGVPLELATSSNYRVANGREIKYIVIHYTAGSDIAGAMSVFQSPARTASSHYIVGSTSDNYQIIQPVLDKDVAYHAGCTNPTYGCQKEEYKTINTNSIGIEVVNIGSMCNDINSCKNDPAKAFCAGDYYMNGVLKSGPLCWQKYPAEQYDKVVALSAILVKKYNIPIDRDHIIGHVEVVKQNKVDPGPAFDLDKFVQDVKAKTALDDDTLISQVASANIVNCIPSKDTDWSIDNAVLSSTDLYSDNTLKISMSIKNKGSTCVNVKPHIVISTINKVEAAVLDSQNVNVYKSTDASPLTTFDVASCTFSSDTSVTQQAHKDNKCVLYVPDDGSDMEYVLSDVSAVDYNNDKQSYSKELRFKVKKSPSSNAGSGSGASGTSTINTANIAPNSMASLTPSEKMTIEKTQKNLGSENLAYIGEIAKKYNIPVEVLLGKITLESAGFNYPINLPSNKAIGVSQVEGWQHYDTIQKVCGSNYISECGVYDKTTNNFQTCRFEKFGSDVKCQIEVGATLLKKTYDTYNNNNDLYEKTVKKYCTDPTYQQQYLSYTGWERALRAYNGFGCSGTAPVYVGKVMKYASGWGYTTTTYSGMVKEEIIQGVFGTHTIRPVFNIVMNFDMNLFNRLSDFAKETVNVCGGNGVKKPVCIQEQVNKFNANLPADYKQYNVQMSTDCDADPLQKAFNTFIEEVNDCMNSKDELCQCEVTPANEKIISAQSSDSGTIFNYIPQNGAGGDGVAYLDWTIKNPDNTYWKDKSTLLNNLYIDEIKLYKNKGLFFGDVSSMPASNNGNGNNANSNNNNIAVKKCSVIKVMYRFCLKTSYRYTSYNPTASNANKFTNKDIVIPFAITIRDKTPPNPVKGISSIEMPHTKNSIILTWDKHNESDVVKYKIYLSDDKKVFDTPTMFFSGYTPYKTATNIPTEYKEYKSIDFTNPTCILKSRVDASGNTLNYCSFEYKAIDTNDNNINLILEYNTTYYLSSSQKILYLLNGTDPQNGLVDNTDKTFVVTALDADDNEIDNENESQKITDGQNMITTKPKNNLELGFVRIISAQSRADNLAISLSWEDIKNYIDGTDFNPQNSQVSYDVKYSGLGQCQADPYRFDQLNIDGGSYTNTDQYIDVTNQNPGHYCIAVNAKTAESSGYQDVLLKDMEVLPPLPPQPVVTVQ